MNASGSFRQYPALAPLPPLVRKQRRLSARIASLDKTVDDEKAVRADIDALLVEAGICAGQGVTCLGYDVQHNEREGRSVINPDKLTALLVLAGVDEACVADAIAGATERGKPAVYATVAPMKGARVINPK